MSASRRVHLRSRRALRVVRTGAGLATAMARGRPRPFSMTFILTHRCNFRCAHCDVPDAADAEMSTHEIRGAIDELCDAGMMRASFSGGEALLREDVGELIRHAHERGCVTSLNTNGWLRQRFLDEVAPWLDLVMVSLDGPEPAHDLVRREGSFARALETLRAARARGIATTSITVLQEANLHLVDEVLALAARESFWAYFQPAYLDCFDHAGGLDPALPPRVLADLAERLGEARARGVPVGASDGFLRRLARAPRFGDCSTCAAGRYFGTVFPDGKVLRCHLQSEHAVDGRAHGFAEAFARLPRSSGPGCAISPYQELDLVFGLDRDALRSAVTRLRS